MSEPSRGLRPNSLGLAAVVFFVIATVAPMSGTIGALPLAFGLGSGAGTAASFVVVAVVLILFTLGYMAMGRRIASAGGFYVFIGNGLGARAGRAAGYLALVSYNAFQIAIWGTFGYFCNIFTLDQFGFELPWVVWVLAGIAVMGLLGFLNIDVSAKVLGVAVVLEVAMILVMNFAVVARGGAGGLGIEPLTPDAFLSGNPAIGVMFCALLFIGFEATAIYSEEAREPHRTIPRAAIIAVLVIAGFYIFTSWSLAMAWGVEDVAAVAAADPGGFVFGVAAEYLGPWSVSVMLILFIVSTFATNLGFHNAIARYQFSLARDRWVPRAFERTHVRHASPFVSSLTQTGTAAIVVIAFYLGGAHPYYDMFTWLISLGGLGLIALMALTSVAIVVYFARSGSVRRDGIVRTLIAPVVAAVALGTEVVLLIANWDLQTVGAGGLVPFLPLVLLVPLLVGFVLPMRERPAWLPRQPERDEVVAEELR